MGFNGDPLDPHQDEFSTGTDSKAASARLIREIAHHVNLLHITHEALVCVDEDCNIALFNQGAEKLFGYRSKDIIGLPLTELLCPRFLHDEKRRLLTLTRLARDNRLGFRTDRIICRRRNGERFPTDISLSLSSIHGYPLFTFVVRDTTQRQDLERQLTYRAEHDDLTDLPNRALLNDRLDAGIARASRYRRKLGVIYLDLDGFKPINDRYGHETGDRLLQAVAQRLTATMRQTDTVSRVGGDEFVIFLEHLKQRQDAGAAAAKIAATLNQPYCIDNRSLRVSASLGIAVYPDNGSDSNTLLRRADEAMYQSKARGGQPQFFDA